MSLCNLLKQIDNETPYTIPWIQFPLDVIFSDNWSDRWNNSFGLNLCRYKIITNCRKPLPQHNSGPNLRVRPRTASPGEKLCPDRTPPENVRLLIQSTVVILYPTYWPDRLPTNPYVRGSISHHVHVPLRQNISPRRPRPPPPPERRPTHLYRPDRSDRPPACTPSNMSTWRPIRPTVRTYPPANTYTRRQTHTDRPGRLPAHRPTHLPVYSSTGIPAHLQDC